MGCQGGKNFGKASATVKNFVRPKSSKRLRLAERYRRAAKILAKKPELVTRQLTRLVWEVNHANQPELDYELFETAAKFGYAKWAYSNRNLIAGRDVLDVGCGAGLDSLGFLLFGAKSYRGIDPSYSSTSSEYEKYDPPFSAHNQSVKNRNGIRDIGGFLPLEKFPMSVADISKHQTNIEIDRSSLSILNDANKTFDLISMNCVTEHLISIETDFDHMARMLRKGGRLAFLHHNFYSWNGHHLAPKNPDFFRPDNAAQLAVADWGHLSADFGDPEHYFNIGLNKITLSELQVLVERRFRIVTWRETVMDYGRFRGALASKLLSENPHLDERDFLVKKVYCVAKPID